MTIELDHAIVSTHHRAESARQLAELLGVPWGQAELGPFTAVYVNPGLTLDFMDSPGDFTPQHFCFRVSDAEFDAILARIQAADVPYRANVFGPMDRQVSTAYGGRGIYWNQPDGHQWEMLTASYARQPK